MRHIKPLYIVALAASFTLSLGACSEGSQEAERVQLPVFTSAAGLSPAKNALGYTVTITSARVAISDVGFTTNGELHVKRAPLWKRLLINEAQAHPGHYAGGDMIGELAGRHVATFGQEAVQLGEATMITGQYNGLNLTLTQATTEDGLGVQDAMLGHSVELVGQATRGDRTISFVAQINQDEGRQVVGAPFDQAITTGTKGKVEIMLLSQAPGSQETLFEGVDFEALDSDNDDTIQIAPGEPSHNLIRRALSTHEFYQARFIQE